MVPILEGLDGVKKMSKSLGNYVGLNDSPTDMFGKLMSISDELMVRYYDLLLGRTLPAEIHPLEAKKQLGAHIVQTYHSAAAAGKVVEDWNARFSEKRLGDTDLPEVNSLGEEVIAAVVTSYATAFGITKSRADARRLVEQGSVQLDGQKILDPKAITVFRPGQVLRLDKTRAVRIAS